MRDGPVLGTVFGMSCGSSTTTWTNAFSRSKASVRAACFSPSNQVRLRNSTATSKPASIARQCSRYENVSGWNATQGANCM